MLRALLWAMLHLLPSLPLTVERKLDELDGLRAQLADAMAALDPPRQSALRDAARAAMTSASAAIEGFCVTQVEALALATNTMSADPDHPAQLAVEGCARALEHVGILSSDPTFRWLDRVLLDLHFDACSFQRDRDPGLWRTRPIGVVDGYGRVLYRAPGAERVPTLMAEVVEWLEHGDLGAHLVVRAAMAHLHVVSVHPFSDGNGRVSRIVHALVLGRGGPLSPELASIDEYLWEHRPDYYEQLQQTHGGRYEPGRSALGWVAFCVEAHLSQARRRLAAVAG